MSFYTSIPWIVSIVLEFFKILKISEKQCFKLHALKFFLNLQQTSENISFSSIVNVSDFIL